MTRRMTFAAPCALLLIIAGTTCVDCAIHPYTAARFTPLPMLFWPVVYAVQRLYRYFQHTMKK